MDVQRRFTQVILVVVAIILLVAFSTARAEELNYYDMHGQNKRNGLLVIAKVWEADKQGNLKGKVWDELTIQDQCNGTWVGYGVAQLGCGNGQQYILMVVEK